MFSKHNIIGILLTATLAILVVLVGRAVFTSTPMPATPSPAAATVTSVSPAATSIPPPTPNIEATVQVRVQATIAALSADRSLSRPRPVSEPLPEAAPARESLAAPQTAAPPEAAANPQPTPIPPPDPTPAPPPALHLPPPPQSGDLISIVQQVKSGVVRIRTTSGGGTGTIFETTDQGGALILTNYHVIKGGSRITVRVDDNQTYPGTVVGFDITRDLAVLEICCGQFTKLDFYPSDTVMPGSDVIAIGYALGMSGDATVTRGIVSASRYDPRSLSWVLQTDAPINPGNSGGPLLLTTGEVIGINSFLYHQDAQGSPANGISFAIAGRSINIMLPLLKRGDKFIDNSPSIIDSTQWQTYTSPEHNYTFNTPVDWIVDYTDPDHVRFESPDGTAVATVLIPDFDITSGDLYFDTHIARLEQHFDEFELLSRAQTTENDLEKTAIHYRGRRPGGCIAEFKEQLVITESGAYWVGFSSCQDAPEYYKIVCQPILDSLKIVP